jgi:hypothetical protein
MMCCGLSSRDLDNNKMKYKYNNLWTAYSSHDYAWHDSIIFSFSLCLYTFILFHNLYLCYCTFCSKLSGFVWYPKGFTGHVICSVLERTPPFPPRRQSALQNCAVSSDIDPKCTNKRCRFSVSLFLHEYFLFYTVAFCFLLYLKILR